MKKFLTLLLVLAFAVTSIATASATSFEALTNVNVRSQAKVGNNRIDHLMKGQKVELKRKVGNWCHIVYKKYRSAYVYCPNLIEVKATTATKTTTTVVTKPKTPEVPKVLSAEAIALRDYNAQIIDIREKLMRDMQVYGQKLGSVSMDDYPAYVKAYKDAFVAIKNDGLFDAAQKKVMDLPVPTGLEPLQQAALDIYARDFEMLDEFIAVLDSMTTQEGMTSFYEKISSISEEERALISKYNALLKAYAEEYQLNSDYVSTWGS